MHAPRIPSQVFTPWPQMPRRCGQTSPKHTQSTLGSPGPIWYCRVPRNHDNDTGDVASGHQWPISCTHRVYQAKFLLLGLKCPVGAAKPRHNIRNPHVALQGPIWFLRTSAKWFIIRFEILMPKWQCPPYKPSYQSKRGAWF